MVVDAERILVSLPMSPRRNAVFSIAFYLRRLLVGSKLIIGWPLVRALMMRGCCVLLIGLLLVDDWAVAG